MLSQGHGYHTRALSIDDLHHDHPELVAMRQMHPENKLVRARGHPGTHDEALVRSFFAELFNDERNSKAERELQSGMRIRWRPLVNADMVKGAEHVM